MFINRKVIFIFIYFDFYYKINYNHKLNEQITNVKLAETHNDEVI